MLLAASLTTVALVGGGAWLVGSGALRTNSTEPQQDSQLGEGIALTDAPGGCGDSRVAVQETVLAGGADPVRCDRDDWTFRIPASAHPGTPRRTEAVWKDVPVNGVLDFETYLTAHLGEGARLPGNWQVVWQLHGPVKGRWGPPAMGLSIDEGKLRIAGGNGHPDHSWEGHDYWWRRDLANFADGRVYRVRVQSRLSTDPAKGWISVWVDGRQVLDHYKPTSRQGRHPGTVYPGQTPLASRTGLYRGSQPGAERPTDEQSVRMRIVRAG